jgi:hypothetical protein
MLREFLNDLGDTEGFMKDLNCAVRENQLDGFLVIAYREAADMVAHDLFGLL